MLIAIEGTDGAGKGTQADRLVVALRAAGVAASKIAFPQYGRTKASAVISKYLNGEFGPMQSIPHRALALLFAEDRFQSLVSLKQMMREQQVVIADRYVASNMAYQGARCPSPARTGFLDWLASVEYRVYGMPRADLTLYLDMPVETSSELVAGRGVRSYTDLKADLHERDVPYLRSCRAVYRDLCARQYKSQWHMIDCIDANGLLRSIGSIHEELLGHVKFTPA